ncbi:uncharacterized protein TNCV_2434141 [Trichonephila clavipes]|nr:uncharacterized protein TNCV_2434141 [Trichonephila clavipes]
MISINSTVPCKVIHDIDVANAIMTSTKFTAARDFCEVWFLPQSVARVAAIVGDHNCHTPLHGFKETLDVFLGYSRPNSFHSLPKLIWCGSWRCNLGQSLSNHGSHVFNR